MPCLKTDGRSPSKLSSLARHIQDATPLMCSILSGAFEAAYTLLDAGASSSPHVIKASYSL